MTAAGPPEAQFELPPYRHLPGVNARHDQALFDAVKRATPPVTRSAEASRNPAWRHGLALLAGGYYWECHEVLEGVWRNAPPNSQERIVTQAVIQIANGALKQELGRERAAGRLADIALSLLADLSDQATIMGLRPGDLAGAAAAVRDGMHHTLMSKHYIA